jgi:2-C-methyl-D-erythritol 4-phosphate cytidylyltransferase
MGALSGRALPKQYLPLAGKPLIWHALSTLCATPAIADVFVVWRRTIRFLAGRDMQALSRRKIACAALWRRNPRARA